MEIWMQKVISSCERFIQHGGAQVKAFLQAILVSSPLELLHVDFTGIEMTMELDWSPHIVNILVFCDHFIKHVMVCVTPNQRAKTVAKFLWQSYILIFRAQAKLLRDQEATFESNIISKLCEVIGIQKTGTSPYNPQTNSQVKWDHQMLIHMIGKLVKIGKQTGLTINQNWCMLTTSWDQPSLGTTHHTWCLAIDHSFPLTFTFQLLWTQKNTSLSITMLLTYVSE